MHAPGDVVVVSGEAGAVSIATGSGALAIFEPDTAAIVDVNDAWVRLFGYSREEARTMRVTDVSAELEPTRDATSSSTKPGGPLIEVRWCRRRDGKAVPVRLTTGVLRIGERSLQFALLHDITERLRATDALSRSEESYRALVECVPDGVIVHRDGFIVFMNPAALRILGYSSLEQFANRPAIELVHPDDREAVIERVRGVVVDGRPTGAREERLMRADGTAVWAEVTALPTMFDGRPAVLAIVRDLTARKHMEAQLVTADRLASLGRLAASVGHEINNPLSYVLGNIELLRRTLSSTPGTRDAFGEELAAIETGALRMRDIVRDLKRLTRSDPEELGPVDVNRVVELCAEMAGHEIRQRARLVRDLGDGVVANAQEGRLGQVIINLLVNAGQALASETVDDEVRISTRRGPDGSAIIEVRDTGEGISPAVRERIFEPFFTTRAPGGGTGLGLSICHHLVSSFHGTIEVEPNRPRGTCFRVNLPAPPRPPLALVGSSRSAPNPGAARSARVLVVEDEALLASVLRNTLADHHVTIASGCAAAREVLADGVDFDLILCDVLLGDGTAADVVAHLRERDPESIRRVVLMTGGASTPEVAAFLATAERPVLEKPFSIAQLESLVNALARDPRAV